MYKCQLCNQRKKSYENRPTTTRKKCGMMYDVCLFGATQNENKILEWRKNKGNEWAQENERIMYEK